MTKISKAIFDRHPDWRDKFWQFVRFGVVGTVSSAIHYGVYCLVLLVANANISFTAGYAVGFICNYWLIRGISFIIHLKKLLRIGIEITIISI